MSTDQPTHVGAAAGFWQRIGAICIDILALGLLGVTLGSLLTDELARMGQLARFVGFSVALVYFGTLNSELAGGQTLGKLRLRPTLPMKSPRANSWLH